MERGKIYNRQRANQVTDFSGMKWNNITPTDIDGALDFGGKIFIYFELKLSDKELPAGQRLHLERLVDNLIRAGCQAYAIVAEHNTDANQDIAAADCLMREFYAGNGWKTPANEHLRLKDAIDGLLQFLGVSEQYGGKQ